MRLAELPPAVREDVTKMGLDMYLVGPDDPTEWGPTPLRGATFAFLTFLVETAKRDHLDDQDEPVGDWRSWDAEDIGACAALVEEAAAELTRVAGLLRGPRPELDR